LRWAAVALALTCRIAAICAAAAGAIFVATRVGADAAGGWTDRAGRPAWPTSDSDTSTPMASGAARRFSRTAVVIVILRSPPPAP